MKRRFSVDEHLLDVVGVREQHAPAVADAKISGVAVLAKALLEEAEHVGPQARQGTEQPVAARAGERACRGHYSTIFRCARSYFWPGLSCV